MVRGKAWRVMKEGSRRSGGRRKHAKVVDLAKATQGVGGDLSPFGKAAELFLRAVLKSLDEIEKGTTGGDAQAVEQAAQTLKASLWDFSQRVACQGALSLDRSTEKDKFSKATYALRKLRRELKVIEKALRESVVGEKSKLGTEGKE